MWYIVVIVCGTLQNKEKNACRTHEILPEKGIVIYIDQFFKGLEMERKTTSENGMVSSPSFP